MKTTKIVALAAAHSIDPDHWWAGFGALIDRIGGRFARHEPRRHAAALMLGLMSDLDRKNCWSIAEHRGAKTPDALQHLLSRSVWDADLVRDDLRGYVVDHLGHPGAVLVVDETGDLKKGMHSVGVQRQYTGTAGRIENSQVAVYLAYASPTGHALIDRALYLPQSWTEDPDRCTAAGIPPGTAFATKPALATAMITAALDAGTPASWIAGDEVYGADPTLRTTLEDRGIGYVLAIASNRRVPTVNGTWQVDTLAAALPAKSWQRLSAGAGSRGQRMYSWAWIPITSATGQAWVLLRRNDTTGEIAYYRTYSPALVALHTLVKVAGQRWRLEDLARQKTIRARKSRMDQRTRERLPVLPVLMAHVHAARTATAAALQAAQAVPPGAVFPAGAGTLRRSELGSDGAVRVWADDPDTGKRRNLTSEEDRAFWTWAAVQTLRYTGIRIEELTELSHHSLIQYTLPSTGETVPMLQIAPSKTDTERLLVISPELADVLAAIIRRVRGDADAVGCVASYDTHERVWNPPMPLLFQRRLSVEHRAIPGGTIRDWITGALDGTGVTDPTGQPLRFTPHDFRRLFITDAILHGMPPHIAQLVAGHRDINTNMGYKAVYPAEVINGHRAFIARRRGLRPSEEYRVPTEKEWQEFLGHFERRKVALGTCGRSSATPCIHEHSCLRCPLLRPDPAQRPRLLEVRDNLIARIAEARQHGWLGEVDGLQISLNGAREKLHQLEQMNSPTTSVNLGLPSFGQVAGRSS